MIGTIRLRRGVPGDVEGMHRLKRSLAMERDHGETTRRGGFLLGSSRDAYRSFIDNAEVFVLDNDRGGVCGFAIALSDGVVRASDLWGRRGSIDWENDRENDRENDSILGIENEPVAYFEQLAVASEPSLRLYAPALAMAAYRSLRSTGHRHLFATVVRRPIHNHAAVPLLETIGARRVGSIDELYEGVGAVVSDVYHLRIPRPGEPDPSESTPLGTRITEMMWRLEKNVE